MDKTLKFILVILLFLCLGDMPSEYYVYISYFSLFGFAILAYNAKKVNNQKEIILYIVLALFLQPFLKLNYGIRIWNLIYFLGGVSLLISIYKPRKKSQNE